MLDIICFNIFVVELKGKQLGEVEVLVIGGYFGVIILLLLLQVFGVSFIEQEVVDLIKCIQNVGIEVVEVKVGGGFVILFMGQVVVCFGLFLVCVLQGE